MTDQELKTEKFVYLKEVSERYTSETRSVLSATQSICKYLSPNGYKCAIGYKLTDDQCRNLDVQASTSVSVIFSQLPDSIQIFGLPFLDEMQYLHDSEDHWDETGLSEKGMDAYKKIERKIKENAI